MLGHAAGRECRPRCRSLSKSCAFGQKADGASLSDVADLLAVEIALGLAYGAFGYLFIRSAERLSLRHATLDRA